MARAHVLQRAQHHGLGTWVFAFELVEQSGHRLSLRILLRPTQIAGQNRELCELSECADILFGAVHERAHDDERSAIGDEPRWHRPKLAREAEVQKERLQDVVSMMSERDLVAAELFRDPVEDSAPQPRAER